MWENYNEYLCSGTWQRIRSAVLKEDGYECLKCGDTQDLCVHHGEYPDVYGEEDTDNLWTLCKSCHELFHEIHGKYFTESATAEWIIEGLNDDDDDEEDEEFCDYCYCPEYACQCDHVCTSCGCNFNSYGKCGCHLDDEEYYSGGSSCDVCGMSPDEGYNDCCSHSRG